MNLIFVNRFFYPDVSATSQMLSDLAFALAERGHDVTVICSRLDYQNAKARLPAHERVRGVNVLRVASTGFGRRHLFGRAADYLSFAFAAAREVVSVARAGDVVVAKTDPPLLQLLVGPAARFRRAHSVNWLQDIFPEVAMQFTAAKSAPARGLLACLRWFRDRSLRRTRLNVVLGERMREHVLSRNVTPDRVRIIPNWADGQLVHPIAAADNALRQDWGYDTHFVVGYSGNLGRAHDVETLVEAIALVAEKAPQLGICWLFIGGGALVERLGTEIERRSLRHVSFRPYQPREKLAQSLSVPDVHLVSLRPEFEGFIVPSKYYGIAAAGRAAIFIGDTDGEIARLLAASRTGYTVAEGDAKALAQIVIDLATDPNVARGMGVRARMAFDEQFSLARAVAAWEDALEIRPDDVAMRRDTDARGGQ